MARLIIDTSMKVVSAKPEDETKIIHGSGFTHKLAIKTTKATEKEDAKSLSDPAKALAMLQARHSLEQQAKDSAAILDLKRPSDMVLDAYQLAAVQGSRVHKHFVIIGAAGTGKTTVTKQVVAEIEKTLSEINVADTNIKSLREKVYSIAFCSFTGKAVQQIKRALGEKYRSNCMTAHKLLGYHPELLPWYNDETKQWEERKQFVPLYTATNKLPYDVIVIDEGSMFPVRLFNQIMEALKAGARIIIIGDINQLPPVMDAPLLPYAMLQLPTFELKHIHRQAADNPIIANAHRILQGLLPIPDKKHFIVLDFDDGQIKASNQLLGTIKKLHGEKGAFNPMTDGIIVPTNKDLLGQVHLNADLMKYFNPPKEIGGVVINRRIPIKSSRGHRFLAIGDKIMLLQNDNDLGLTNGMTGVIVDITINGSFRSKNGEVYGTHDMELDLTGGGEEFNLEPETGDEGEAESEQDEPADKDENQRQASHITTVKFSAADGDVEVKFSTTGQYNKIAHAYAITCHKSQGGEYPTVVIGLHSSARGMLNREWLYTAVTRAQNRVILFCNNRGLMMALKNQAVKGQTIAEKANSFLANINNPDVTTPNLPKPELMEAA